MFIGLVAFAAVLAGCRHSRTVREFYPNGARKSVASFLIARDSAELRHGLEMTWYPDGSPATMEFYRFGYLEGNAFQWYPGGKLKSKRHYTDGVPDPVDRFWDRDGKAEECAQADAWADAPKADSRMAANLCSRDR